MIIERNVELAERLGSRKATALYAAKMLWEALLVLVCIAIVVVLVIGFLHGDDMGV